jgi:predicted O-methyltransferase YrrM
MRPVEQSKSNAYVESLYAVEDSGLENVRKRLEDAGRWGVNIAATEGKTLQLLIKLIDAKKIVEIGTLYGYSTVWMARATTGGHVFTIERDPICIAEAQTTFLECGIADRVTLLNGDALAELAKLSTRAPFDMVFIDANKSAYVEYLQWATANVRVGGLIVADNTLMRGKIALDEKPAELSNRQWTQMREFNSALADGKRYFSTILPTEEGLSVAIRL